VTDDRERHEGSLLVSGGPIRIPAASDEVHEAVLIRDGRIAALGPLRKLAAEAGVRVRRLDLEGACLLPAFFDAHVHLRWLGHALTRVDLAPAKSLAQALDLITHAARTLRPGEWLQGRGWDRNHWTDGLPTREALDRIVPDNPAALSSHDGHTLWVNSAALAQAGVTRDTQPPAGGAIWRDEAGEPTGLLSDAAIGLVSKLIPEPTDTELKDALSKAVAHCLRVGVVAVRNCESLRIHRLLRELAAEGKMPIAVACSIQPADLAEAADVLAHQSPGDRIRIENLKLFADGALGSQTALLLEPYEDPRLGVGLEVLPTEALSVEVVRAADAGLGVAIHAIGDRAVRQALDAIEQGRARHRSEGTRRGDPQQRGSDCIEHAQLVHPEDLPRFARLGVTASVQPCHLLTDIPICERHWGERSKHAFPVASLIGSGARVIFGSDGPVEPLDPRRNLFAATLRRTVAGRPHRAGGLPPEGWYPKERVSLAQALSCQTVPADVGSRADLVVLARDPFAEPLERTLDNEFRMTIVGGEVLYRAP